MKKKKSATQALAAIRKAAEEGTLEFAPQTKMDRLEDDVYNFLNKILGVKCAFVSDESHIRDFSPFDKPDLDAWKLKIINKTKKAYGIDIGPVFDEPIVDVVGLLKSGVQ